MASLSGGIPFTIPSNLLKALYVATRQKLQEEQYQFIEQYRKTFFNILNEATLVPFSNEHTSVFTITPPPSLAQKFTRHMMHEQLLLSYESDYLKKRKWCQLATFGYYTEKQLRHVSKTLQHIRYIS